jgi:hypothetical protein
MATINEIPTEAGQPFSENVTWDGIAYALQFHWNSVCQCWMLDIADTAGVPLLTGLALVTGCDVLEQFSYLPLGAHTAITVVTIGPGVSPDTVPSFDNLGTDGHVYLVMP